MSYWQKFDFDRFGNLYRKANSNFSTGQQNPLPYTQIEDTDISKSTNRFTSNTQYDDAGNVTSDYKFRSMSYSYDANGRMVRTSTVSNTNQASSVNDASGNRVATKVDGVWTYSIYDIGGKLVSEYSQYYPSNAGVKYILSDWQGSSRAIVNNTGTVQARMDYSAFGEEINSGVGQRTTTQGFNSNNNLNQKYALTERDKATGLDHTTWRKNENKAGRWTSPDPYNGSMSLGNPQSFNRYSYVENEPTNFVDPSGLSMIVCRTYDEGSVDLITHVVTIHERTVCEEYFSGGGGGPAVFPVTGGDPGIGGGGGTEPGGGGNNPSSQTNGIENCKNVLKQKGLLTKVNKLNKTATFYDIDKIQNQSASKYFGNIGTKGLTVGQYFDNRGGDGFASVAGKTADGKPIGKTGIYSRGGEASLSESLRLHEVTHLAYPFGSDLDISLAKKLNIQVNKGQDASDAVSNYFNNDCDPKLLNQKKGGK